MRASPGSNSERYVRGAQTLVGLGLATGHIPANREPGGKPPAAMHEADEFDRMGGQSRCASGRPSGSSLLGISRE